MANKLNTEALRTVCSSCALGAAPVYLAAGAEDPLRSEMEALQIPVLTKEDGDLAEMIAARGITGVLSGKVHHSLLNQLLWCCPMLQCYFLIDTDDPYAPETKRSKLMNKLLWEFVSKNAANDIEGGGWISSYTREYFSKAEMDEYADNAYCKLKPYLRPESRVFEIGCASGLTMFRICPEVQAYTAIDLSCDNINKNRKKAEQLGLDGVRLEALPADRMTEVAEGSFNIVLMNSVSQCLSGINYLRRIITDSVSIIGDQGYIFIGDVMDLEQRDALFCSLKAFHDANPQYDTKLDLSNELYIAKDYFRDIAASVDGIRSVSITEKIFTIHNELTDYRYDVLLEVDRSVKAVGTGLKKRQLAQNLFRCAEGSE